MKSIQEVIETIKSEKYEDAKIELEKIIRTKKDDFQAYHVLGVVFAKLSNFDKAIHNLNLSVSINPKNKGAYFELGNIYRVQSNNNESKNNFLKALNIDPNFIEAHISLAKINESENNFLETDKIYQNALSINNEHLQLNKAYANFLIRTGEISKGLSLQYKYSGVIRFNKNNLEIL